MVEDGPALLVHLVRVGRRLPLARWRGEQAQGSGPSNLPGAVNSLLEGARSIIRSPRYTKPSRIAVIGTTSWKRLLSSRACACAARRSSRSGSSGATRRRDSRRRRLRASGCRLGNCVEPSAQLAYASGRQHRISAAQVVAQHSTGQDQHPAASADGSIEVGTTEYQERVYLLACDALEPFPLGVRLLEHPFVYLTDLNPAAVAFGFHGRRHRRGLEQRGRCCPCLYSRHGQPPNPRPRGLPTTGRPFPHPSPRDPSGRHLPGRTDRSRGRPRSRRS